MKNTGSAPGVLTSSDNIEAKPGPIVNRDSGPEKPLKITASNGWKVLVELGPLPTPPPKKRVKHDNSNGNAPKKRVQPRSGKLRLLPSLPLDILLEIFGHLAPQDLLSLARATKALRRVVLDKNAIGVWRQSFKAIDAPPCPNDLQLPAWASLMFDTHCRNCMHKQCKFVDWALRTRVCETCAKGLLFSSTRLKEDKMDKLIKKCVRFGRRHGRDNPYCLVSEKDAFEKKLDNFKGDRNALIAKIKEDVKEIKAHAKVCEAWEDRRIAARERELRDTQSARETMIRAKLLEMGYEKELQYLALSEAFMDGLAPEAGQLALPLIPDSLVSFSNQTEVRQTKPLTEKQWDNRVKYYVKAYMDEVRKHRIKNEENLLLDKNRQVLAEAWVEFTSKSEAFRGLFSLPEYGTSRPLPTIADFLDFSFVETWLDHHEPITVSKVTDWLGRLFPDTKELSLILKTWHNDQRKGFIRQTPVWVKADSIEDNLGLELAITVFTCQRAESVVHYRCLEEVDDPRIRGVQMHEYLYAPRKMTTSQEEQRKKFTYSCMWFPEFMHHGCNTLVTRPILEKELELDECMVVERFPGSSTKRGPWKRDHLTFDWKASVVVNHILLACGLDWKETTTKQLDELDPRVVCLKCNFGQRCDGERRCSVMSWRYAVRHAMTAHWGPTQVFFEKISDEDAKAVKALEEKEKLQKKFADSTKNLVCTKCRGGSFEPRPFSRTEMKAHLRECHEVDLDNLKDSNLDQFYQEAVGCSPLQPLPVKFIPRAAPDLSKLVPESRRVLPWSCGGGW
ncbi:hypothetical protein BKA70DRAFT_1300413 [Coprinopsis sp. MPI-PUGE-AT-0042]|nr:hypothetical protein BKA70DRAFT_1300413 [Coprinopsis sp. MPI-PUGE-AT-0042]